MVDTRRVAFNLEILKYQGRIQKALNISVCVKNDSDSRNVSPLVLNIFGIEFPNLLESMFQALRRFSSMLNGLRPGKLARLNRLFQNDLHSLSEFLVPGVKLAFVIVKFHIECLWCWCTWPLIAQQARCIEGWGFRIKSGGAWIKRTPLGKLRVGTGYVWRSVCEPILIAAIGDKHDFKGRSTVNLVDTLESYGFDGLARQHSRKPEEAYDLVDALLPSHARKADIFSRQVRPGWDSWGDQVDKFEALP